MAEKFVYSGKDTIRLVKQLIRYDIPFLLLGKSSIGKSYSIIELSKRWRMPTSMLYIGSEKPSNIEGLPRLTGKRAGGELLEFYKPAWFPDTNQIEAYVTNGKQLFEDYVENYYDAKNQAGMALKEDVLSGRSFFGLNGIFEGLGAWDWGGSTVNEADMVLMETQVPDLEGTPLNSKPFVVKRDLISDAELRKMTQALEEGESLVIRDDVRDMCLYVSTILGYGNYWLVLDELDKVDESEQDKYAPLLHIVRERTIKSYSMRTLNEGKGAQVPKKVDNNGGYGTIKKNVDNAINLRMPLLDTRIIGIANATDEIEDALFRRFCHLIIEEVMMVTQPPSELSAMRTCLNRVSEASNAMALTSGLQFKLLNEVNLQWQFGFFPTMLNKNDAFNNFILKDFRNQISRSGMNQATQNAIGKGEKSMAEALYLQTNRSALFKIIRNNFGVDDEMNSSFSLQLQQGVYSCLAEAIIGGGGQMSNNSQGIPQEDDKEEELQLYAELIKDALADTNNDPKDASIKLMADMQEELSPDAINAKWIEWMRQVMGLVENADGTLVEKEIIKQFYPVALTTIFRLKENIDFKKRALSWVNNFLELLAEEGREMPIDSEEIVSTEVISAFNYLFYANWSTEKNLAGEKGGHQQNVEHV